MNCLVLSDDLMFCQLVNGGLDGHWNAQFGKTLTPDSDVQAVVIDLNLDRAEWESLAAIAKQISIPVCGIASHVHVSKIESAKQVGISVLTRGQVERHLMTVLSPS